MKQNITTFKTSLLLAGSLALAASCQDYEPFSEQQVQDRAYTQAFENQFGEIDPNQDWDLFGQLARHIGPVTRAGEGETPSKTTLPTKLEISEEQHDTYTKVLPELDIQDNTYENSNLGQVTQDFTSTARKFTLAPVHWTTSNNDAIGIYWYVDEEDDETTTVMGKDEKMYYIKHFTIFENQKVGLSIVYEKNDGTSITQSLDNVHDVSAAFKSAAEMEQQNITRQYLLSEAVEVNVPNSISTYGFWIRHPQSGTRYSEWNLNRKAGGPIEADGTHKISYTATFNLKGLNIPGENDATQYLCFEDWFDSSDADLNDVVYHAEGLDETTIVDKSAITENAILVCEDLAKFDFDFNDVALGLTYKEETGKSWEWVEEKTVGGKTIAAHWEATPTGTISQKLTVLAMAAGGAYESTIYVGGTEENPIPWDEIHMLLHEDPYKNGTNHAIINAGATYAALGDFFTIDMSSYDWNVGTGDGQYATHLSQLFLEDYFRIACTDGSAQKVIGNRKYNDDKSTNTVPQMMLFPWYFEWPQEMINIKLAYTGFADWVADYTKTNWIYDTQVADKVTDRGEFKSEEDDEESSQSGAIIETMELDTYNGHFDYYGTDAQGNPTHTPYDNGIYIDLKGVSDLLTEGAKAEIIVHYSLKPASSIYLDDSDGKLLIWDQFGDGKPHTTTYTLSANKFNQALNSTTCGMWLFAQGDPEIGVSKVELRIIGVTDPDKRHVIDAPASMEFEELNVTQAIGATCSTGTLTYSSTNTNVATVDENGNVTSVGVGTTVIIVSAEASGEYLANVKRISVTVTASPTATLILGETGTCDEAFDSWSSDKAKYVIASTTKNLASWTYGATIQIVTSDNANAVFKVKDLNGNVIADSFVGVTGDPYTNNKTFDLTADQLAACKNSDGSYQFRIECSAFTSVGSATLTKK